MLLLSLQILDGYDSTIIGIYCGSYIPTTIVSRTNVMAIVFDTNNGLEYKGFNITWRTGIILNWCEEL